MSNYQLVVMVKEDMNVPHVNPRYIEHLRSIRLELQHYSFHNEANTSLTLMEEIWMYASTVLSEATKLAFLMEDRTKATIFISGLICQTAKLNER